MGAVIKLDEERLPKISRPALIAQAGLLVLLTLAAYLPALRNGFIWDDDAHVTGNLTLRTVTGLFSIWLRPEALPQYYPLVHTTFWIEYHLWGLNPFGYHLVNVLFQALNALLLWRVLERLRLPGAWLVAAIFAVHPVQVETVAWITERKNLLAGAFYLSALLAYARFSPWETGPDSTPETRRCYWPAYALFVCALLSKTVTCTLPAAILLLVWWKRGRLGWRDARPLVPFFAAGALLGMTTVWIEKNRVGASGMEWSYTMADRVLIAGRALWFYATKLVWPRDLIFIYPRWAIAAGIWWQWLFPAAAAGVTLALWMWRTRLGRGPVAAVLFFAGTLAPALGFVNVFPMRYSFVADHFQYLASIGLIALAVAAGARVLRQRAMRIVAAGAVIAALGILSWQRCGAFHDEETLWRDTLAKNPGCWMACNNLGLVLERAGDVPDAYGWYGQALQIKPDYADAHINLGNLLSRAGRLAEAAGHYEEAMRIEPGNAKAPYDFGLALAQATKWPEAIAKYQEALRILPHYAAAHNNLANALSQTGNIPAAIDHYKEALRIDTDFAEAHNNLGFLLASQGRIREAIAHYREALRIDPDYAKACNNLARLLTTQEGLTAEDRAAAVTLAERACRLTNNKQAICLDTLAGAYAAAGRLPDAIRVAQQAVALANATGQNTLAADIEARLNQYKSRSPAH